MPASNASRVIHRALDMDYPVATNAKGLTVTDAVGREYLDGVSGAAVCSLGYGDDKVIAAVSQQLHTLAYVHSASFTTPIYEQLAARLTGIVPGAFAHAYIVSGGSEAVETALKLARQYAVLSGRPEAHLFASRHNSYHGATIATLAVGGSSGRRALYEPLLMPGVKLDRCYAYRDQREGEDEAAYTARLVLCARERILAAGADQIAALIVEPVVGAALGATPAPAGYLKGLRALCDEFGILLIFDEIMCGMGRTGTIFAFEQEGVVPDIAVIAKGLGAGYQSIGAVLVSAKIYEAFEAAGAAFQHGHTYTGHATACAAGLAVIERLIDDGVAAGVPQLGAHLFDRLTDRLGNHPHVGDIRGRGLFAALEFVAGRATKTPFAAEMAFAKTLKRTSMANGLICYPMSGFIDGASGDHVLIAPAFIARPDDIDGIVDRLARSIDEAIAVLA